MNIYVGNFSAEVTQEDIKQAFEVFGQVENVSLIKDKFTGESRGFGFVVMPGKAESEAAINGIKEIKGRMVVVNEARPKTEYRKSTGGGKRDFSRKNKSSGSSSMGRFKRSNY